LDVAAAKPLSRRRHGDEKARPVPPKQRNAAVPAAAERLIVAVCGDA
jgi:hypothetical protein